MKLSVAISLLFPTAASGTLCSLVPSLCPVDEAAVPTPPAAAPVPCVPNSNPSSNTVSSYDITPMFDKTVDSNGTAAFGKAVARWTEIIIGDIPYVADMTLPGTAKCGSFSGNVDDIMICLSYADLDGVGKRLAMANPVLTRTSGAAAGLTSYGEIVIDSSDVGDPRLENVLLNTMLQVIGFGELWAAKGIVDENCKYIGPKAVNEWGCLSGCQDEGPPVYEVCQFWSEDCMKNEIMSVNLGLGTLLISRITIASLEDLGYSVNYSPADRYTADDVDESCLCSRRRLGQSLPFMSEFPKTHKRKLSDSQQAAREDAIEAGKEHLRRAREVAADYGNTGTSKYVGGDSVFSFYVDPDTGNAVSLKVTAEDL